MDNAIRVGSTPINTFEIPYKAEQVKDIEIIYKQGGKEKILKRKSDIELSDYLAKVELSQDDTFNLDDSTRVQIQLRVKDNEDRVIPSDIIVVSVEECLFNEVF
jgi:hypothetical protein